MSAGGRLNPGDVRFLSEKLEGADDSGRADNVLPIHATREAAIEVSGATLRYPIGPYVRGSLKSNLFQLFGRRGKGPLPVYVDAIRDLDLTVGHGERVGIVGSNGSGKSSLLRALAGIYPLNSGTIHVTGNIGTLLDTALGFETESTGRENIYYRGVSMGYSPKALRKVEQEIVDFADIGEFIDLPMRTYSAGMYVRLGFSISTQFSPEVLLIDEVFSTGDASFASRAIDRMMRMVRRAGIMMLATHDTALVSRICTRVLWMNKGKLVGDGHPSAVLPQFEQFCAGKLTPE